MANEPPQRVTVVDLDISFFQAVVLVFKFALAAIPTALLLALLIFGFFMAAAVLGIAL